MIGPPRACFSLHLSAMRQFTAGHSPKPTLAPQIHRKGNQRSELLTALLTDQR